MNQARLRRGIFTVNLQNLRFCAVLAAGWLALGAANFAKAQNSIPCRYEIANIIQGPPCSNPAGYSFTVGTGISPDGHWVVGYYAQCPTSSVRPFYYDTLSKQFSVIPLGSGFYDGQAADVNNDGVVVGTGSRTNVGQRGFVYRISIGEWTELLPLPGGVYSSATGINSSGVVCGWRSIGPGTNPTTAFYWTAQNGFTDLGLINGQSTGATDINDLNSVAGGMIVNGVPHPFLWRNGKILDLGSLAGFTTGANGMNNKDQVVGYGEYQQFPPSLAHWFLWQNGTLLDMPPLPGFDHASAYALSNSGLVIGKCFLNGQNQDVPFIWKSGDSANLRAFFSPNVLYLSTASDINDAGEITGYGLAANGNRVAFVISPVWAPIGDTNNDCVVNVSDLLRVINDWGLSESPADLDQSGIVGLSDLMIVILHWTGNT